MKYISFSLWGDKPIYNVGAIKNAELWKNIYPDWGYGGGDQIHRLNSINNNYDMQVFMRRQSNNFGL
jgi:hypothetical protein